MSLIRKPAAAEQESSLRRAAEATIASGRAVRDVGQELGSGTRRVVSKVAQLWLLVGFTFGALMASSIGAKVLGLAIMAPFWYLVLRRRAAPVRRGGSTRSLDASAKLGAPDGLRTRTDGQLDAVEDSAAAMRCAGPKGWGADHTPSPEVAEPGFDPDAAIARYLARKDAERSQPVESKDLASPQQRRPQFGKRRT